MKKRKFRLHKGLTTTIAAVAILGAAHAAPVAAAEDVKANTATPETSKHDVQQANSNVVSHIDETSWNKEGAKTSEDGKTTSMVGTSIAEDHTVNGTLNKTETKGDSVEKDPVYDPSKSETTTDSVTNGDGSTTTTTTTTTPGKQETETTINGSISGTTTEDKSNESAKDEISSDVSDKWQGILDGSVTNVGGYTVTKNEDGSYTFAKESKEDASLNADELLKLFGKDYSYNSEGKLVDKDGNVITITGNKVTVSKKTTANVEIKDNTETGKVDIKSDVVYGGAAKNYLDKLTGTEGNYTFDGEAATVETKDGRVTKITVGNKVYDFTYTDHVENLTNAEIAKKLGATYDEATGKFMKDGAEVSVDNVNALKKNNITVSVKETVTDAGTSGSIEKVEGNVSIKDENTIVIDGVEISKDANGQFVNDGKIYTVTETEMTLEEILAQLNENKVEYEIKNGEIVDKNGTAVDLSRVKTKKWSASYTKTTEVSVDAPEYNIGGIEGKFDDLNGAYNAIFGKITGTDFKDGKVDTIKDANGNVMKVAYSEDGRTVTITSVKEIKTEAMTNKEIAKALGEGYSVNEDGQIVDASGHVVTITENKGGHVTFKTTITIVAKTKPDIIPAPTPDKGDTTVRPSLEIPDGSVLNGKTKYESGDTITVNGKTWTYVSGTVTEKTHTEWVWVPGYFGGHYAKKTVVDGYEYSNVVWKDADGTEWDPNNQLNFYIRLDGSMPDYTTAGGQDKSQYTSSVGSSILGSSDGNYLDTDSDTWIYQNTVDKDGNKTAGDVINSMIDSDTSNNIDYGVDKDGNALTGNNKYALNTAPSDESVFEQLFNSGKTIYYQTKDSTEKIKLKKSYYEEHKNDFSIYWYVLKKQNDGFHIDGCVIYNPSPNVGPTVTVKNWYEIGESTTTTETIGSANGKITVSRNDVGNGYSINGQYSSADKVTENTYRGTGYTEFGETGYTVNKAPTITVKDAVTEMTNEIDVTYTYTTIESKDVTDTKTETNTTPAPSNPDQSGDNGGDNGGENTPDVTPSNPEVTPSKPNRPTTPTKPFRPGNGELYSIGDEETPLAHPDQVIIEDNKTPFAGFVDLDDTTTINEDEVPLASVPKTGAAGNAAPAAVSGGLFAAIAALFVRKKRKNK